MISFDFWLCLGTHSSIGQNCNCYIVSFVHGYMACSAFLPPTAGPLDDLDEVPDTDFGHGRVRNSHVPLIFLWFFLFLQSIPCRLFSIRRMIPKGEGLQVTNGGWHYQLSRGYIYIYINGSTVIIISIIMVKTKYIHLYIGLIHKQIKG